MAVEAAMFSSAPHYAFHGLISDALTDWHVALVIAAGAVDTHQDDWLDYADITNEVAQANGYLTTGVALASPVLTVAGRVTTMAADSTVWTATAGGIAAQYAVVYDNTPAAGADKKLIMYVDFGATLTATSANFTINWNNDPTAGTMFTVTVPVQA